MSYPSAAGEHVPMSRRARPRSSELAADIYTYRAVIPALQPDQSVAGAAEASVAENSPPVCTSLPSTAIDLRERSRSRRRRIIRRSWPARRSPLRLLRAYRIRFGPVRDGACRSADGAPTAGRLSSPNRDAMPGRLNSYIERGVRGARVLLRRRRRMLRNQSAARAARAAPLRNEQPTRGPPPRPSWASLRSTTWSW